MRYTASKQTRLLISALSFLVLNGCEKTPLPQQQVNTAIGSAYSSVDDFLQKSAPPAKYYTINGSVGGSFTTPQGTIVTVPPAAFIFKNGNTVTTDISIEFIDIYKKSDMLLYNMPTAYHNTFPLKSAGEFFILAKSSGQEVQLNGKKPLTVQQPMNGQPYDATMSFFVWQTLNGWSQDTSGAVTSDSNAIYYFLSLYRNKFSETEDSGTWCNSDDSVYFSAYTETKLTLHPTEDPVQYDTHIYLLFKGINSMVEVPLDKSGTDFSYLYAPFGLQCTVVGIAFHDGNLYSSFLPITIYLNQTVDFSLTQTTSSKFLSQLAALN